jgi:hypothetical protein
MAYFLHKYLRLLQMVCSKSALIIPVETRIP